MDLTRDTARGPRSITLPSADGAGHSCEIFAALDRQDLPRVFHLFFIYRSGISLRASHLHPSLAPYHAVPGEGGEYSRRRARERVSPGGNSLQDGDEPGDARQNPRSVQAGERRPVACHHLVADLTIASGCRGTWSCWSTPTTVADLSGKLDAPEAGRIMGTEWE